MKNTVSPDNNLTPPAVYQLHQLTAVPVNMHLSRLGAGIFVVVKIHKGKARSATLVYIHPYLFFLQEKGVGHMGKVAAGGIISPIKGIGYGRAQYDAEKYTG